MRAAITALLTIIFIASYNIYIYSGLCGFTDPFLRKAAIYSIFAFFILPLLIMGNCNNKSSLEIEFRKIAQMIYAVVTFLIIVNQFGILKDPIKFLFVFNGITFAFISLVVLN